MYKVNAIARSLVFFLLVLISILTSNVASATLNVNINKGTLKPVPFVVGYFGSSRHANFDLEAVIIKNLRNSGFFKFLGYSNDGVNITPDFTEYKNIGATLIITGDVHRTKADSVNIHVRVWDAVIGKQIFNKVFTTKDKNWRRVGHIVSDEIYKRVTGYSGYFDSKIVYIAETGDFFYRKKRLAVMDQDGENVAYLTSDGSMVLSPSVSASGEYVAYVSYIRKVPKVYLLDVRNKIARVVSDSLGMTTTPKFYPGRDDLLALSVSDGGRTNIYKFDLRNKKYKKLTQGIGISTYPTFSPEGRKMAFVSDRTGSQQIYTMNSDGTNQARISTGYGQYSTPSWSPTGEYIAFTKIEEREFFIGVMRPNGSDERLLAKGYLVEGPSWSPNGRVIIFAKEDPLRGNAKKSKLYTVDITGRNERILETPTDASDPAWSPLMR